MSALTLTLVIAIGTAAGRVIAAEVLGALSRWRQWRELRDYRRQEAARG